jgi:hypothetical protein
MQSIMPLGNNLYIVDSTFLSAAPPTPLISCLLLLRVLRRTDSPRLLYVTASLSPRLIVVVPATSRKVFLCIFRVPMPLTRNRKGRYQCQRKFKSVKREKSTTYFIKSVHIVYLSKSMTLLATSGMFTLQIR